MTRPTKQERAEALAAVEAARLPYLAALTALDAAEQAANRAHTVLERAQLAALQLDAREWLATHTRRDFIHAYFPHHLSDARVQRLIKAGIAEDDRTWSPLGRAVIVMARKEAP